MATKWTKRQVEAEVANAVVRFHREQHGRGPNDVRVTLIGDMLLVRSAGVLTPMEAHLVSTDEGRKLVKSARGELRAITRSEIEGIIQAIVTCGVLRSYGDIDVEAAEQIEVYVLDADLERRLLRQDLDGFGGAPTAGRTQQN